MSASLLLGHLEESSCSGPELVLDLTLGGEVPRGKDWWGAASAGLWGTGHSVRTCLQLKALRTCGSAAGVHTLVYENRSWQLPPPFLVQSCWEDPGPRTLKAVHQC